MVSPSPNLYDNENLIDKLLSEQQKLQTPVARFSEEYDSGFPRTDLFKHLIPLEKPKKGEQYAFQVELDKCTGCKACVVACHTLNGLDEDEAWRDVGLLESGNGFQQTVTTACHHCVEPECLHGCPVGAYEKEKDTGIVRHLDDQCIGCEYCILKCPYDVPKYSHSRGIVRKCDMCHQRLEVGEAPACVQACPTGAISIIKVEGNEIRETGNFLPGTPTPKITYPSTRYIGRLVPKDAASSTRSKLTPQHTHWPLVLMLTLTQIGLGLSFGGALWAGLIIFNVGMIAAVFHLGQPLKAWRFFLGLKTSWLSREILAFSLIAPLPVALLLSDLPEPFALTHTAIEWIFLPAALGAIFTSVMIYHDTKRVTWDLKKTLPDFFLTFFAAAALFTQPLIPFAICVALLTALDGWHLFPILKEKWSPIRHSAQLRLGPLHKFTELRFLTLGLSFLLAFISSWLALPLLITSQILSRKLFFQSVHAPKMP
ncbi:MAG: DmsC/YnfH family molybdoenzyme membrane anchor subunit [Akkermansiaceae bacterium]